MKRLLLLLALAWMAPAQALTADEAKAIALGESDARIEALNKAIATADDRTAAFLQALADDVVKVAGDKVFIVRDGKGADPVTGAAVDVPADAEDVVSNNRMRSELDGALAALQLFSPDAALRRRAVQSLQKEPDEARLPLIEKAYAAEKDAGIRDQLGLVRAAVLLGSSDKGKRLEAARLLGGSRNPATKPLLVERLREEPEAEVKAALAASLRQVDAALAWGDRLGALFSGVSLGSILLLVALGLAITYGLMGVINMAHGELMMIGAYATYVVQGVFRSWLPGHFDWYLVAAVPVSFAASAAVGAILERGVIRFLYGRPLETLLATWGISLMLMQLVRSVFGAQNVGVENPSWMSGGVVLLGNLQLPWNRIVIVGFAFAVLAGMAFLIARTRLGLFVRGVTQNRPIASCMGVNTARIDTYAFALGSGIAGLAGCALSQIGNVGPDLGQAYIVDSFMVVVLGGVGQLAGTVYAALGLGILNKFIEGWAGAVLAKIAVLVLIVVFIQKRPQGLFAVRGRSAEA
ncbi:MULTISPECIES: urea ABC transporter permease subunit UrtB [Ramlibacter]|uniref:Urea ABC transporter permease subunit UrtB n=1 Tax=Ramlibacter pinisoli TaxID=2682844 RepID=A0A6N8ITG4_9BURK|nr:MULTISPECIES: urea ABC transporter permease subunit UrtB [Ramlibacter]MBA2964910.1 urea ABC transporter permease subunit UrtB [Ramlibacter sp. CGMCC 1.13660]MVQ29875.1 urea ABC transporter permease subunit UrtB [Ramlibacter pinisoli]